MGTCIGNRNYRYFYYFLLFLLLHMIFIIINIVFYYIHYYKSQNPNVPPLSFSEFPSTTSPETLSSINNSSLSSLSSSTNNNHSKIATRSTGSDEDQGRHLVLAIGITFVTFFFFLFVSGLFIFHTFLISQGRTTHEQVTHRIESVFSTTCAANWRRIFCTPIHQNYAKI